MKFFIFLIIFLFSFVHGQNGFQIPENEKKVVFPFQLINNLIFVPVNINGVDLTFLLDSGVSETVLFSLDNKQVNFNNIEKIKFSGLGENVEIEGLKSGKNILTIGKTFVDPEHTIYIILNEYINFSSHIGIPVNGIIGYHFFKNYPVEINYITKKITVYNSEKEVQKKTRNYEQFPMSIELNKPYLFADVEMTHDKNTSKLLLDLGNSDAIWLFPTLIKDFVYNRPNIDDYLGRGFNGDIYGKRSRIHGLYLGKFEFIKPLTAMPDEYSIQHLKLVKDRKGSIGSEILRRFSVVFDYPGNKIYLKKNKHYDDPFLFNKSGLDIRHDGMIWDKDMVKVETNNKTSNSDGVEVYNSSKSTEFQYKFVLKPQYSVAGCRKDSPCEISGLKKDDKIISINNKNAGNLTLDEMNDYLKKEDGTFIKLEVSRNGKILTLGFYLVDPIPYQENTN